MSAYRNPSLNACAGGVCVASGVAVEVVAGSCAMAMPPRTAAYRPAQHRAMAKIFLGDRLTGLNSHARGRFREAATQLNFGIAWPAVQSLIASVVPALRRQMVSLTVK